MSIYNKSNVFSVRSEVNIKRSIPWLLRAWFFLLAFWSLSNTSFTELLRGVRIGHQFYYIEFLLPLAIVAILQKPKSIKLPKLVLFFGLWLLVMGIVGYLKGYFPSVIYDRSRNWAAMVLLFLLLHRYKISSHELLRLLKPVFLAALVGYPLAVVFPPINYFGVIRIQDVLGFNFMIVAFASGDFWINRRLHWWHLVALCTAFVVPIFLVARAKLLAMIMGLLTPAIFTARRNLLKSMFIFVPVILIVGAIIFIISPAEQSRKKSLRGGGLSIVRLESTSNARLRERTALFYQMEDLDYLVGKGVGATWDGSDIYQRMVGTERQNFHIYYLEIFYFYGLIGLLLWISVGIVPVMRGFIHFEKLNTIGVMGLCGQTALLLAWFGHAGYSMCEGSYIAISLYALHCGKRDQKSFHRGLPF